MKFKYLEARLKKLPLTEWNLKDDNLERVQPKVEVWDNQEGSKTVCLSSEQGNMSSFEYLGVDYIVDLKQELHDWADQYGWEWECQYQGTYFLSIK